jgi:hypothetical protein
MRHWSFWEWVAYVALFIGATFLALDQSVKLSSPSVREYFAFIENPLWAFAPLIFVILAGLILVAKEFGVIKKSKTQLPHTLVTRKRFVNERVPLDSHSYRDCTFENVTFLFNGTGRIEEFTHNIIVGRLRMHSDSPVVFQTIGLLQGLGALHNFQIDAPGSIIEPPRAIPQPDPKPKSSGPL